MKCSQCQKEAAALTVFVDLKTANRQYLCDSCLFSNLPLIEDFDRLEKEIAEVERNMKSLVNMIDNHKTPDLSGIDEKLSAFLFTPDRVFDIYQTIYRDLIDNRQKLLQSMNPKDRLAYELKMAIKNENYERAAELRDEISKSD